MIRSDRQVIVSADCSPQLFGFFAEQGYCVRKFKTVGIVAPELSNHPDMFMCKMGACDGDPIISYEEDRNTQGRNTNSPSAPLLSPAYPGDIAYNAACTGKYLIHNLRYTAPGILQYAEKAGMVLIDVKQGYAKCSTVIVDEDSIITYDRGIAKACSSAGVDVLAIRPGHVLLPGFDTGFIGGASGRIDDTICFNGDLSAHPDSRDITDFISERGLRIRSFREWPLTDIGSIFSLQQSLTRLPGV